MIILRFNSSRELMKGFKLIVGKFPICIIDGMTYAVPSDVEAIFVKHSVKYSKKVNGQTKEIMLRFKSVMLDEEN